MKDLMDALKRAEDELEGKLNRVKESRRTLEGRAKPGRKPVSAKPPGAKSKPRKRKSGTRADQALALIEAKPGIIAADLAEAMKLGPNYLYRVLGKLEKEKRVEKKGKGYEAVVAEVPA